MHLTDIARRRARLVRDRRRAPADRARRRASPRSYRAPARWRCASSATARPTSAPSTRRSTWPRSGSCRCLRLREQPLRRVLAARARRRRSSELADRAAALRACPACGSTATTSLEVVRRGRRRPSSGRAAGDGPTLIEAMTYRHMGHSRTDPATYRPEGELEEWLRARPDPAARGARWRDGGRRRRSSSTRSRERGRDAPSPRRCERALGWPEPDPASPVRPRLGGDERASTYREAVNRALARRAGGDERRVPARRGRRRRRAACSRPPRGCSSAFGEPPRARHADLRAGDRRHARSARRSRACGRSPRSCSPTSRASASTRSPTSSPSTAT